MPDDLNPTNPASLARAIEAIWTEEGLGQGERMRRRTALYDRLVARVGREETDRLWRDATAEDAATGRTLTRDPVLVDLAALRDPLAQFLDLARDAADDRDVLTAQLLALLREHAAATRREHRGGVPGLQRARQTRLVTEWEPTDA